MFYRQEIKKCESTYLSWVQQDRRVLKPLEIFVLRGIVQESVNNPDSFKVTRNNIDMVRVAERLQSEGTHNDREMAMKLLSSKKAMGESILCGVFHRDIGSEWN